MRHLKRFFWVFSTIYLLFTFLPFMATANDEFPISTSDELMELLKSTYSDETLGKTYVLQNDIEIDTSELAATYSSTSNGAERAFKGILDGRDHTITILENEDGESSKPLFDHISGDLNSRVLAGVKNINLIFEGDVEGTTVASTLSYAEISNVDITFEKNIVFAESGNYSIATGVFGFPSNSTPINITDVTVTGYGIIGSEEAQNSAFVMASGVYSEWNFAGGEIICDGIEVSADGIYAVSDYDTDNTNIYSDCCAAGISSGYSQSNLRLGNSSVNIENDIYAHSSNGADADAYGLGYSLLAMYSCDVTVGGNIEARADSQAYSGSYIGSKPEYTVTAAGMGFDVSTKYNDDIFDSQTTGECSIDISGNISASASSESSSSAGYKAVASGIAVFTSQQSSWKDVSVEAKNIISDTDGYTSSYAVGFAYQTKHSGNETEDDFDYTDCTVKAESISADSNGDGGYVAGFMFWGYATYLDCKVTVDLIESSGLEAASVGFVYRFSPNTSYWRDDKHGEIKGCEVSVESIAANNTYSDYGAEVSGLVGDAYNMRYGTTGAIRDCDVCITEDLSATGYNCIKALLVEQNRSGYDIYDNIVELPKSQADVQTIDGKDYIIFTGSESDGRSRESIDVPSAWESGNRVIFINNSENDIFCRFDDGDTSKTLWELNQTSLYRKISYDLNGGKGANGVDYDTEYVTDGNNITIKDAPSKDGFDFIGWGYGANVYQPGDNLTISTDVTFTALWKSAGPMPEEHGYTLIYDTNGGSRIPSETQDQEWIKSYDNLPSSERNGYVFKGWYYDEDLSIPVESDIHVDRQSVTIYAKWSRNGHSYSLEEKESISYIPDIENHESYLTGYPDGSFRPDGNMTRAEAAQMFYNLLPDKDIPEADVFSDVSPSAWYGKAVRSLAYLGIAEGVTGGVGNHLYEPNRPITRAELTAMAMRFSGLETGGENVFTDVSEDDRFYEEIVGSAQYGWISGYPDGTFRPNNNITRAEVASIVNNLLGRSADESYIDGGPENLRRFTDLFGSHWAYYDIMEAVNAHDYEMTSYGENWVEINL